MQECLPSLFIGSSSEGLEVAREVELQLHEHTLVTIWQHDVFKPGKSNLESLVHVLNDFDFALMVMTPDDALEVRGESLKSPRDNVLFELGLLMGCLGRERTLILSERDADLKLPSDLDGIGRITYGRRDNLATALSPACTQIAKRIRELGPLARASAEREHKNFLIASYPRSQHPAFFSEIEDLVPKAKMITLIATGLNLIWEDHIVDILLERAKSGEAQVTVCMANPFSPHVLDRLVEEDMGSRRAPGRHGIYLNLRSLLQKLTNAGNPQGMRVCLFEHYPTFATLIFDEEIFIYPYAYQVLGTTSPIFHFRDDSSAEAKFFIENARRILRDAIPAVDVISTRTTRRHYSENWIGAAVFALPESDDPFYKLGSAIIGYDVRAQKPASVPENIAALNLRPFIGEAEEYGFHATLADALYFASDAQLDRVRAELQMLAEDFPSFELSNFRVADTLPSEQSIVVLCDDKSGVTEAIHHELVSRVYSTAISSRYLTGKAKKQFRSPEQQRDNLLLHHYGSPNILARLTLHFTLLSAPPADAAARQAVIDSFEDMLQQSAPSRATEINELCLMVFRPGDAHWKIANRYPLSSR